MPPEATLSTRVSPALRIARTEISLLPAFTANRRRSSSLRINAPCEANGSNGGSPASATGLPLPPVGNVPAGGGTETSNGAGPNAFVSAPAHRRSRRDHAGDGDHGRQRLLWVSDGNSQVRVVDPDRNEIIATISTAIAECDGGTATTHYCGRSNEIAYDPVHHVILVSNPSALDLAPPHTGGWGFAHFDDGKPASEAVHNTCFACHATVKDRDFVFNRYAP